MKKLSSRVRENIYKVLVFSLITFYLVVATGLKILAKANQHWLIINSGSMEPTLSRGDLVLVEPQSNYEINDVVTFRRREANVDQSQTVTHRIKAVKPEADWYQTQGDSNTHLDDWIQKEQIVGKVKKIIPVMGWPFLTVKTRLGEVGLIWIPVTIIILIELRKIYLITQTSQKKHASS